jgi:hypothetical protein
MRAIFAIIIAFAMMGSLILALSLAPWYILGVDAVLRPATFESTTAFNIYAVVVAIFGAISAGWVCARIGRSRSAVLSLALLCFAAGTTNAYMQSRKPEPGVPEPGLSVEDAIEQRKEPAWFTLLVSGIGVVGVLFGGRRAGRTVENMFELVTVATIRARVDTIWRILTDSASYSKWNPEIVDIKGVMAPNARIKASVKIGNGAVRTVPLRVRAFEPPARMEWVGGLPFGLFVGRRIFTLKPHDGAVEFAMLVQMSGPLAPMIVKSLGDRQPEIDRFSAGLKAHAEEQDRASEIGA